jgi:hypothetical protein
MTAPPRPASSMRCGGCQSGPLPALDQADSDTLQWFTLGEAAPAPSAPPLRPSRVGRGPTHSPHLRLQGPVRTQVTTPSSEANLLALSNTALNAKHRREPLRWHETGYCKDKYVSHTIQSDCSFDGAGGRNVSPEKAMTKHTKRPKTPEQFKPDYRRLSKQLRRSAPKIWRYKEVEERTASIGRIATKLNFTVGSGKRCSPDQPCGNLGCMMCRYRGQLDCVATLTALLTTQRRSKSTKGTR